MVSEFDLITRIVRNWCLGIFEHAANFTILLPISFKKNCFTYKVQMARNAISSGQNQNMIPLFNSNRGIVTIDNLWS